jgi:hypothetical protein
MAAFSPQIINSSNATWQDRLASMTEIQAQVQQSLSTPEAQIAIGKSFLTVFSIADSFSMLDAVAGLSIVSAETGIKVTAAEAAPGSINLMGKSDDFLINASARTDVDAGGYLDVVAHGDANSIEVAGYADQSFGHRVLAQMLKNDPQFVGQGIRLLSCSTGANPTGFAQNLANKLGVNVLAPSDTLWAFPNGTMTIGPKETINTGSWILFIPGVKP